jgi:hypothetical protein
VELNIPADIPVKIEQHIVFLQMDLQAFPIKFAQSRSASVNEICMDISQVRSGAK